MTIKEIRSALKESKDFTNGLNCKDDVLGYIDTIESLQCRLWNDRCEEWKYLDKERVKAYKLYIKFYEKGE